MKIQIEYDTEHDDPDVLIEIAKTMRPKPRSIECTPDVTAQLIKHVTEPTSNRHESISRKCFRCGRDGITTVKRGRYVCPACKPVYQTVAPKNKKEDQQNEQKIDRSCLRCHNDITNEPRGIFYCKLCTAIRKTEFNTLKIEAKTNGSH